MSADGPEPWRHYRLDADTDDPSIVLVIGATEDFVWVLHPSDGLQEDVDRDDFEDGLADGSIERVRASYETVEPDSETRTQGAAA